MASLSVDDLGGGRFKVRWREWATEAGTRKRVARSLTVHGKEAVVELQAKILRSLETIGFYEPEARPATETANLEHAGLAWLRHKAARGCAAGTVERYGGSLKRLFSGIRAARGLGNEDVVPASALSRELFAELVIGWRGEGLSESTIYSTTRIGYDVWTWAADEPETYPGVPVPPRDASRVLPQPPLYGAPTPPTLDEVDACLRHLPPHAFVARAAGVVMRFTGLRISQVLALRCGDLDLDGALLRVTTGKSRREKAEQRLVPVSRHLVAEIAVWVSGQPAEAPLVRRRRDQRAPVNRNHIPGGVLVKAWEAATKAGVARREVWRPPNRSTARPDHAFRAAFQGFLESRGVRDSVIDFLVGHAPKSVRGRHYAPPTAEDLRSAVELLPPISSDPARR